MEVKIIADSISQEGIRLTTYHLRYWRAIHAELMTHRDFSRNARSSRAVPSVTLMSEEPFVPQFTLNQPGMQGLGYADAAVQDAAERIWLRMVDQCKQGVEELRKLNIHKQHCNRPLEWFGWIDVLVSSTYWDNFYELRISEYAQPEFDLLAKRMKLEQDNSKPQLMLSGDWHLPYIMPFERMDHGLKTCKKLSVARCARLSYRPFDGRDTIAAEMERYEKLVVSRPVHASPAEHQATPDVFVSAGRGGFWRNPETHGNFQGWTQHRKLLPHESIRS